MQKTRQRGARQPCGVCLVQPFVFSQHDGNKPGGAWALLAGIGGLERFYARKADAPAITRLGPGRQAARGGRKTFCAVFIITY